MARRSGLLALAALALLLFAQPWATAHECSEWEEALKTAHTEVEALRHKNEAMKNTVNQINSDHVNCRKLKDEAEAAAQQALAQKEQQIQQITQQNSKLSSDLSAAQQALAELDAQLTAAKQAAAAAGSASAAAQPAVIAWAQAVATQVAQEAQLVFEDLKQGKTERLGLLAFQGYTAAESAAKSAYALLLAEYEEHVPEEYKKQVSQAKSQLCALWKQHVTEAAWAQPLLAQLSDISSELNAFIVDAMKKQPALAPYADPSLVQYVVYTVFVAPLLLLLLVVPVIALTGGKSAAAAAPSSSGKKKSKKSKGSKGPAAAAAH